MNMRRRSPRTWIAYIVMVVLVLLYAAAGLALIDKLVPMAAAQSAAPSTAPSTTQWIPPPAASARYKLQLRRAAQTEWGLDAPVAAILDGTTVHWAA